MRLEYTLARRYITAQKRHTILTLCSIAIAVLLITVLFTAYSTVLEIMRNATYDSRPYHAIIPNVTQEEANRLAEQPYIKSCTWQEAKYSYSADATSEVLIFFEENAEDIEALFQAAAKAAHIKLEGASINMGLLELEGIGIHAKAGQAQVFAMFAIFILFIAFALRFIIDMAFEVSSRERERQFGILQSMGATPKQIVRIITCEGMLLSIIGVPLGTLLGLGTAYGIFQLVDNTGIWATVFESEKVAQIVHFNVSPLLVLIGMLTSTMWVFFSAYGTGMRIVRMSPMESIRGKRQQITKSRKHRLSRALFGWVGMLSAKNVHRQPKRFFITVLSMTLSIGLFTSFSFVLDMVSTTYQQVLDDTYSFYLPKFDFVMSASGNLADPFAYRAPVQQLEESGFFESIYPNQLTSSIFGVNFLDEHGKEQLMSIAYLPKDVYNEYFEGKPPVPYETLAQQDKFIFVSGIEYEGIGGEESPHYVTTEENPLLATYRKCTVISKEEYEALTPEEQENYHARNNDDSASLDASTRKSLVSEMEPVEFYYSTERLEHSFSIAASYDLPPKYDTRFPELIGTLDQYEAGDYEMFRFDLPVIFNIVDPAHMDTIPTNDMTYGCTLKEGANYAEAIKYIEQETDFHMYMDVYGERLAYQTGVAVLRILIGALTILISLIAIVNMLNIISTSLLNRKSEFASMQSVGMSNKQLIQLTLAETLQYVLPAAIAALLLCGLLFFGTILFLDAMTMDFMSVPLNKSDYLSTLKMMLPPFGISVLGALLVGILASFFPMRKLRRESIVENIRSVE